MGKLLPNTSEIREATASLSFNNILDSIEGDFIGWKKTERLLQVDAAERHEHIIDISSATSMNLDEAFGCKFTDEEMRTICNKVHSYPYIVPKQYLTEETFLSFIHKSIDVTASVDEVLVFDGTYAAVLTIVSALPGEIVLVPEFMNQAQKNSIISLGRKVVEVPMHTPGWTLNLEVLQELLHTHKDTISCMYIHHVLSADVNIKYLSQISDILTQANVIPIIDIDILKTSHTGLFEPAQTILSTPLRDHGIFLFTLSKECNAPGLRVGFGIAPKHLSQKIQTFQQQSLEMVSPLTKEAARILLQKYDLNSVVSVLKSRMSSLVSGLANLELEATLPHVGINLFMHVPRAWEHTTQVLPDHLFTYYCLTRAGVVIRPGSIYGHRLNHFVRFVICQPKSVIEEMITRLQSAGIHGHMSLPVGLEDEYKQKIGEYQLHSS
jgi:aspartate/methionine/tyrosine aminotransferase